MSSSAASSMASSGHVVAIAQLCATHDKVANLLEIAKCAGWARRQEASLLCLPENCGFMGTSAAETLANAEAPWDEEAGVTTIFNPPHVTKALEEVYEAARRVEFLEDNNDDSPCNILARTVDSPADQSTISLLEGIRTISKYSQLWISVGGLHVRGASPHPETNQPRWYNTHLVLDDQGAIRAVYRKMHLFDVCIPGKVELRESASTAAGHEVVVCDTPVGTYTLVCARLSADMTHIPRHDWIKGHAFVA